MDLLERDGETVLEALRGLPGGRELLALAARTRRPRARRRAPCATCCSGARPASSTSSSPATRRVRTRARGAAFGARTRRRARTRCTSASAPPPSAGTAGRIDIAARRSESYAAPGALPDVRAGHASRRTCARRDFTVNAIAVPLGGPAQRRAAGRAARARGPRGRAPARAARAQLHRRPHAAAAPRALPRAARLRARAAAPPSSPRRRSPAARSRPSPAPASAPSCASRSPSPTRWRRSRSSSELGVLERARIRALRFDERARTRGARRCYRGDGRADLLLLACLLLDSPRRARPRDRETAMREPARRARVHRRRSPAGARRGARARTRCSTTSTARRRPSQLAEALAGAPVEAIALAGALGERAGRERRPPPRPRWLASCAMCALQINGEDLLAAGIPAGPEIGRRLEPRCTASSTASSATRREARAERRPRGLERVSGRDASADGAPLRAARRRAGAVHRARRRQPVERAGRRLASTAMRPRERARARTRRWTLLARATRCTAPTCTRRAQASRRARQPRRDRGRRPRDRRSRPRRDRPHRRLPARRTRLPRAPWRCSTPAGAGWPRASSSEGVRALRELGRRAVAASPRSSDPAPAPAATRSAPRCTPRSAGARRRARNIDLPAIARERLLAAGVAQVRDVEACTICDERFFSHRREGARAGRQAGMAWLS